MITSFRNPLVRRIRRLRMKKYRQQEKAFFVEGLRVVLSALESGARVETLVYASPLLSSKLAWQMLAEQRAAGRDCIELSAEVFAAISERDHPVGLGAIVKTPGTELANLVVEEAGFAVALVDVSEPGNLGTILRTADATGAAGVFLVGQTVDPVHPAAVRASMGSLFSVPVVQVPILGDLLDWAKGAGLSIVATSAHAEVSFWQATFRLPTLLLFGSERQGLNAKTLAAANQSVSVPMVGSASSLNLAVAAGLLMYELRRRHPLP